MKMLVTAAVVSAILAIVILGFSQVYTITRLQHSIDRIEELREERVALVAQTDQISCERDNNLRKVLQRALIDFASVRAEENGLGPERKRAYASLFQQLATTDCSKLPSQKPFRRQEDVGTPEK